MDDADREKFHYDFLTGKFTMLVEISKQEADSKFEAAFVSAEGADVVSDKESGKQFLKVPWI